jgi:O-antigen/teichoic acid export membrane protein
LTSASPAPQPSSLLRNVLAQSGNLLTTYGLSFIAAPIVVAGLGIREFGIWALTGALAQYGGLIDLGVGRSLSRYVAAHQSDRRACGEYLAIGLITVSLVGMVLLAAAIAAAPLVAGAIHGISTSSMRVVLICSVVLLTASMATSAVSAYPIGMRRMVVPNAGSAAGSVVNFALSVGAILAGDRLPGYALANAIAGVITVLLVVGLVIISERGIPLHWPTWSRTKEFLRYAIKNQLCWAMELVNYQSDKIVIAFAVGPAAAGAYDLANRVAFAVRGIGILPSITLLPTLTAELSHRGMDHLRDSYARLTELIVSVAFPFMWLAGALAPLLLGAWLSHVPRDATVVLPAMAFAYLANVSSDVGKVVASAAGDLTIVVRTVIATAIVNLALTVALAPLFGLWGVLAGTVIALTGGALTQVALVQRRFGLDPRSYISAVLPTLRVCALLAIPVIVISYSHLIHGRFAAGAAVVLLSSLYTSAYLLLAARSGRLPDRVLARIPPLRRFVVAA